MICSIITHAELPYARVLAARIAELHPEGELTALVIDAHEPLAREPGLELLHLHAVAPSLGHEIFGYGADALKTRVAPSLLRYALELGRGDAVALVDAEVDVHAPLDDVLERAATSGLVLVPRLLEGLPDDGATPTEADVVAGGVFASGVLAVGRTEAARRFLEWWETGVSGAEEPEPTLLNPVPVLFPEAEVLRDPGHGVAYWNLPARPLERGPDHILAGGARLRTFYFEGFDPARPHWLNDTNSRVRVTESDVLTALCEAFAERLKAAGWVPDATPSEARRLANGVPLDAHMRALIARAHKEGVAVPDPFDPAGADELLRFANGPAPVGAAAGVTRFLYEVYRARADLQRWLPDLDGEDGGHFMQWARLHGIGEERIDERLLSPAPAPARSSGRLGVNVAGYLSGGLGLGEAARAYVRALQAVDVAVHTESVEPPLPPDQTTFGVRTARKRLDFDDLDAGEDFPLNLVCVNAPEFPGFASRIGSEFFAGRKTIAVWAWETSFIPPHWDDAFGSLDEIWTYTTYVANVLAQRSPVPVVAVPLPVTAPTVFARELDLGLRDGYTFLFAFDFFSTIQRKNPIGLVEAFKRAFAPGEGPQLVLKSFNGDYKPEHLERLRHASRDRDDITIVDRFLSVEERNGLMARADCYVSLHRSEGFGLTLAEAMSLGKPVIATAYSGNLDFMDPSCGFLVDYELTEVGPGVEIYPAEGIWAEPDIDHAAALMRHVVEDPADAAEKAERGRARVAEQLSPEACGALARGRLERLMSRGHAAPAALPRTPWPGLDLLAAKASFDPIEAARGGDPRQLARRAALQAMRPFTYHQREFNDRAVQALRELHGRVDQRFADADARALSLSRRARRAEWRVRRLEDRVAQLEQLLAAGEEPLDSDVGTTLRRVIEGALARPASGHSLLTTARGGDDLLAFGDWNRSPGEGYAGFEDIFRGSEEEIRERQRFYLPMLEAHAPVLDVGCGRGEMLELLRDAEIEARGVDLDPGMVERCRAKGLAVDLADAVSALEREPEASLGAVVAMQVVDHLPSETLLAFIDAARTRIIPGGVLIAEAVNPHSPAALKAFWTDPTHQHPIPPEVLLALCRLGGFDHGRVVLPGVEGRFDDMIYDARDYAVVATRKLNVPRRVVSG